MQESLFPLPKVHEDTVLKKKLQQQILKKRKELTVFVMKVEVFRVELEMAKQEYNVRVGSLYLKDNQLDLEIIHLRNILDLMNKGLSYDDALNKLQDTYYAEQREYESEKKRMHEEEEVLKKRNDNTHGKAMPELKKLWKNLISKFHPDLVQESEEKKRREGIMKKINRAYEELDFDQLKKLENEVYVGDYQEVSYCKLQDILVTLENEIILQQKELRILRSSEWYDWKIRIDRAKLSKKDIFAEMERKLLDDIVGKLRVVKDLRAKLGVNS